MDEDEPFTDQEGNSATPTLSPIQMKRIKLELPSQYQQPVRLQHQAIVFE